MKKTEQRLVTAYEDALDAIEPTRGMWTMQGFSGSAVNVGKVELKSGKMALVKISIEADEDEIECECDDFEALTELERLEKKEATS